MILTYVHKKLRSVNQCPVTSCRKVINRRQEEKVLPPFQGKSELALIFKTLSQVIDGAVFLERGGKQQSSGGMSDKASDTSEYLYQHT